MKHTSDIVEKENTMRALQGKEPLRTVEEMVERFQHYVNTYELTGAEIPETFLNDMLYCIGSAMSDEYRWALGYRKFKAELHERIDEELTKHEQD